MISKRGANIDKEERIITAAVIRHDIGVFFAEKHRRLIAGGILAAAALIVLYALPDLYGYSAGTAMAVTLCRMLAWFSAITGMAVFFSNIREFDFPRYIAAAVTCAVVILMLISARGVLAGMDITVRINYVEALWGGIAENLPIFAAALTGSVFAGYVFGRKRA